MSLSEKRSLHVTLAERFLAAQRDTDRTACARYLRAHNINEDDTDAVERAKTAYHTQPLLLDPEVAAFSRTALLASRGSIVNNATPFPATLYFGGATDTRGGRLFKSTFDNFIQHVLINRSSEVAEKRKGWVVTPVTTKTGIRKNADTLAVHALNLDCDGRGEPDVLRAVLDELGFAYILYQSGGWSPSEPKWHLLLPLARPFQIDGLPENWLKWRAAYSTVRTAFGAMGRLLGEGFDPSVDTPCVPVFITERRRVEDPPRQVVWKHGASLDFDLFCVALPVRPEEDRRACERAISEAAPLLGGKLDEIVKTLCEPMSKIYSGRRELYMALPGALLDRGVPPDDVYSIIEEVSNRCPGDPRYTPTEVEQKHKEHLHCADTTIAKYEAGEHYTRIGTLGERWPTVARAVDLILPDPRLKEIEAMMAARASAERIITPGEEPQQTVPPLPVSLEEVRKRLLALRARKKRSMSNGRDELIRYAIIDALLRGEDLVPRDSSSGAVVTDSDGRLIDRDRAVSIAMGMMAYSLPVGTPFGAVRALALHALAATAGAEVPLSGLLQTAEWAFARAAGNRVDRDQQKKEADTKSQLTQVEDCCG